MSNQPRRWDKRYTIKQTCFGSLVVMVSQYVPDVGLGDWIWSRYRKAGQSELREVVIRLAIERAEK